MLLEKIVEEPSGIEGPGQIESFESAKFEEGLHDGERHVVPLPCTDVQAVDLHESVLHEVARPTDLKVLNVLVTVKKQVNDKPDKRVNPRTAAIDEVEAVFQGNALHSFRDSVSDGSCFRTKVPVPKRFAVAFPVVGLERKIWKNQALNLVTNVLCALESDFDGPWFRRRILGVEGHRCCSDGGKPSVCSNLTRVGEGIGINHLSLLRCSLGNCRTRLFRACWRILFFGVRIFACLGFLRGGHA